MSGFRLGILLSAVLWLCSCASLVPSEPPKVNVVFLKRLPPEGLDQRFLLGLRLSNPNKKALPLESIHYRLSLNGRELFNGTSGQLPVIAPRADTNIELEARITRNNLINVVLGLSELLGDHADDMQYQLDADLQLSGHLPDIHLSKTGVIRLD